MQPSDDALVQTILGVMSDGVLVLDEEGAIQYANPAAGRLLARPAETLVAGPCPVPVPAQGDAEHALPSGAHLKLQVFPITWRAMPARLTVLRLVDEHGRAAQGEPPIADLHQDLLAREQRARADAERQRALLQSVLDHAPAMMFVLRGSSFVYEYVNDVYCTTLGRSADELLGCSAFDAFPEIADVGMDKILGDIYRTGQPVRISEMRMDLDLHRDGTLHEMYFSFSGQPMRSIDGQVTGVMFHVINVTDQVLARRAVEQQSAEVTRLNQELDRRVQELATANQELEAFAHSVSHDLRAPLQRIDGFGQALIEDCADRLSEAGRHYLARIRAATEHMGELIEDLLTLSQVSRLELQTAATSVSELASEIVTRLRELAPAREVAVHVAPDMVARCDARLLRIALENLLENAWKFTSKKPATSIEVGQVAHEGERVFFVRDDGVGFDPLYSEKLFGTFNRLHSPSEFPGVGIGLVTVKRVIERHGGRIWAEGAVDRGAIFYFTLPDP